MRSPASGTVWTLPTAFGFRSGAEVHLSEPLRVPFGRRPEERVPSQLEPVRCRVAGDRVERAKIELTRRTADPLPFELVFRDEQFAIRSRSRISGLLKLPASAPFGPGNR